MAKSKRFEFRATTQDINTIRELKEIWLEKSESSVVRKALKICRDKEHERQAEIGRLKVELAKKNIRIGELYEK